MPLLADGQQRRGACSAGLPVDLVKSITASITSLAKLMAKSDISRFGFLISRCPYCHLQISFLSYKGSVAPENLAGVASKNQITKKNMGIPEMIIILLVVLLLFGAKRIPELARGIGRSIGELKKARYECTDDITTKTKLRAPARPSENHLDG